MDVYLIQHALVDSYWKFCEAGEAYPFVPKRELKPRARVMEKRAREPQPLSGDVL